MSNNRDSLSSNFYENMLNGDYDVYEKLASEEADRTLEDLSGLSQYELDALANELGSFAKEANDATFSLEDELTYGEDVEMIKQACEEIEDNLAYNGLGLADYIYSLTGTEKCAYEIADSCEKIAMVYDVPRIVVAQDLVNTMFAMAEEAHQG